MLATLPTQGSETMKRPIPVLIALAMTAVALPHGASAESIAVFTKNTTNPFSKAIRTGSDFAAKKLSIDVSHYVPTTADNAAEQAKLVDDAIAKKPDLIVFDPVENQKMVPAIEKMNAANIPVVEITDRAEGGKFVSSVLPDDYQLGLATARRLLKALDGKGNVVILEGIPTATSSIERVKGFNDALKEVPAVKLLASKSGGYQRKPAQDLMERWISQFPPTRCVLGANDSMSPATVESWGNSTPKAA